MQMPGEFSSTTQHAIQQSVLTPRFYTTDYDAVDKLHVDHMHHEFEWICDEFAHDYNKDHFRRNEEFLADFNNMPERKEFIAFLERSCTAEFSGCILYAEMVKHLKDPTMQRIFQYMSRDEGRHAGFLNKTMADLNVAIDLTALQKRKKYTFFKPKFIFYTVYLSEKIGYARYITIYRHLQQHPEHMIHPIFKWFEKWCNDEYRHGEFFSVLMRSQPELLQGVNQRWIRFFMLAVYATMYLNDSRSRKFYQALGLDWRDYDQKVIRLCNDICTQVYPVTPPIDDPRWFKNLDDAIVHDEAARALDAKGDLFSKAKALGHKLAIGLKIGANLLMKPQRTTETSRWKGLDGFPNYPGQLSAT